MFVLAGGGLLYKLWALIPLAVILEVGAILATKYDPQWLPKVWRFVTQYKKYYKA